jgi:hypothetical protein
MSAGSYPTATPDLAADNSHHLETLEQIGLIA